MNICLEIREINLIELSESEFLELLDHADNCKYHAAMLESYEAEMIPLMNLACSESAFIESNRINSIFTAQNFYQKILGIIFSIKEYAFSVILKTKNICELENGLFYYYLHKPIKNCSAILLVGITLLIGLLLISSLHGESNLTVIKSSESMTYMQAELAIKRWNSGYYQGNISY